MDLATIIVLPGRVRLLLGRHRIEGELGVSESDRFDVRAWRSTDASVILRAPSGRSPLWRIAVDGSAIAPLPPVPGEGPLEARAARVHGAAGVTTVLDPPVLWVLEPQDVWTPRALPDGMDVRDVSLDRAGGLWCAGEVPSGRIPGQDSELALRYQRHPGGRFGGRTPRLGLLDAARIVRHGGFTSLRHVDADGEPVVVTSICAWFLDDPSTFAFLVGAGKASVVRLEDETVAALDRPNPGQVRLVTHEANIWTLGGSGKPSSRPLGPAVLSALGASSSQVVIRNAALRGDTIALAVEVNDGATSAALASRDGGATFEVVHRAEGPAEVTDVVWMG